MIVTTLNMVLGFVANYTKRVAITTLVVAFAAFAVIMLVGGAIAVIIAS